MLEVSRYHPCLNRKLEIKKDDFLLIASLKLWPRGNIKGLSQALGVSYRMAEDWLYKKTLIPADKKARVKELLDREAAGIAALAMSVKNMPARQKNPPSGIVARHAARAKEGNGNPRRADTEPVAF